jgi:hypothetical protein
LGLSIDDDTQYSRGDELVRLTGILDNYCDSVGTEGELKMGDILVFRCRTILSHCGYYTGPVDNNLIHAYDSPSVRKVAEHPLNEKWVNRIYAVYRYKNMEVE